MTRIVVLESRFTPAVTSSRDLRTARLFSTAAHAFIQGHLQHSRLKHAAAGAPCCGKLRAQGVSTDSSSKSAPRAASRAKPAHKQQNKTKVNTASAETKSDRAIIVKQLLRITTEGAYAGLLSGSDTLQVQDKEDEAPRQSQSRSVTFTVSNIVRWQRQLDFFIASLTGKPCSSLEPALRTILRLGVYEVVHQNLSAHVISEHVDLAKKLVRPAAGKLVNAVLRRLLRELEGGTLTRPPMPSHDAPPQEAAEMLAVATSHPTWMVLRWLQRLGQAETLLLLEHNNRPNLQYGVRIPPGTDLNPTALVEQLNEAGRKASVSQVLPEDFLKVNGLQYLIRKGLLREGRCQVQDEAAGLVVALLDPQPGDNILDACAAPGGKTLYAAAKMKAQGRLVAMDINQGRLGALSTAAAAQGLQGIVETKHADLCQYATLVAKESDRAEHLYDRVLLDAPCTGLGVLAKRADLRWRRTPEAMMQLVTLQEQLLDAAASLVKPGGLLVYSTCSIEPEENEDQVSAFLGRHPEFTAEQAPSAVLPADLVTKDGFFRALPHVHNMDGAFGARLRRDL